MATTLILSCEQSDLKTVTYFQSRMKTVWTELPDDADAFDVKNAVASGTYGLIKNDCSAIFKAYASYKGGSLNEGGKVYSAVRGEILSEYRASRSARNQSGKHRRRL